MNEIDKKIQTYLTALSAALASEDKALIQDALYDAEHHFREALNDAHGTPESIETIIEDYGSPEDIAAHYQAIEASVQFAFNGSQKPAPKPTWRSLFSILKDPKAYQALAFHFLALPIGILAFAWTTMVGIVTAVASILVFGIPLFLLYLQSMRYFSLFEGRLIETFLGERMPRRPHYVHDPEEKLLLERVKLVIKDRQVWTSALYLALKMPISVLAFHVSVVPALFSLAIVLSPIVDPILYSIDPSFTKDLEFYWLPITLPAGVVGLTLSLYIANWLGSMQAKLAKYMLVQSRG